MKAGFLGTIANAASGAGTAVKNTAAVELLDMWARNRANMSPAGIAFADAISRKVTQCFPAAAVEAPQSGSTDDTLDIR